MQSFQWQKYNKLFTNPKFSARIFIFSVTLTTSGLKCRCKKGLGPVEDAHHPTLTLTKPSPRI